MDIENLLKEISPEEPSGKNLDEDYTSDYGELERAARGKPEQQIGDKITPAEEPEWATVRKLALGLFDSTRDLRVAVLLTRALIRTDGWPGFRDGLVVMEGMCERFWDTVHPQLDPDDNNDPTYRMNTVADLCGPEATLDGLRAAILVESRGIGRFSLRDMLIASGELPAPKDEDSEPHNPQMIAAAFQEADPEQLREVSTSIDQSLDTLASIETILMEKVGAEAAPDLSALSNLMNLAKKTIAPHLSDHLESPPPEDESPAAEEKKTVSESGASSKPTVTGAPRAINTREDVVRTIDLICAYYDKQEPSSPIPILLQRAKRLVAKDFLTILQDLAPDGVSQLEKIKGPGSQS
jgi:type VI secretion system protein ImpA